MASIDANSTIAILSIDGQLIVSAIKISEDGLVKLIYPCVFDILKANVRGEKTLLAMDSWLPVNLVSENEVDIPMDKILYIKKPSNDFKEYYTNEMFAMIELDEQVKLIREQQEKLAKQTDGAKIIADQFYKDILENVDLKGKSIN